MVAVGADDDAPAAARSFLLACLQGIAEGAEPRARDGWRAVHEATVPRSGRNRNTAMRNARTSERHHLSHIYAKLMADGGQSPMW